MAVDICLALVVKFWSLSLSVTASSWSCLVLGAERSYSICGHVNKMNEKLLYQILDALTNAHGTTLYDMILETLRNRDMRHAHHRASILDRMPDLINLLSEQSPQQLEMAVTITAAATYRNEVQHLIQPQTGFHFSGNKTNLSQLESFSVTQMGVKIQEVAPNGLCGSKKFFVHFIYMPTNTVRSFRSENQTRPT